MKDKLIKFIRDLFQPFDGSEYIGHWIIASVPASIIFQVLWFLYGYYFEMPIDEVTPVNGLLESLWWAFGGIIIYYLLFSMIAFLLSAILHKKPYRIIILIVGFIGMFFAYHRMV